MASVRKENMKFELTILAPERNGNEELNKIEKTIKKYATITKFENAGSKRLAYDITLRGETYTRATYLYYDLEMEHKYCAKLSSELNITDEVLRYLLVRV